MGITAEQRIERRNHIGSSDMAAILGLDPFKTAYDLWLDKTGRVTDIEETPAMYAGKRFEDGVLDFAQDKLGALSRNQRRVLEGTPLAANIDAVLDAAQEPVEAKTVGLFGPVRDWWGDDGTDQVPDRVIIQTHVEMLCLESKPSVCHVPAFIGGRGFAMFHVPRNEQICDVIVRRAVEFWQQNVQGDTPPDGSAASLQIVKLLKREPKKIVNVAPELVKAWLEAKEIESDAKKAKEAAEAQVLAALSDGEAGLCGELGAITYYETTRKGYEVKETTYRTLRHKQKGL